MILCNWPITDVNWCLRQRGCMVILSVCLYPHHGIAYSQQSGPVLWLLCLNHPMECHLLGVECLFNDPSLSTLLLPLAFLFTTLLVYSMSATLPSWVFFELARHPAVSGALHQWFPPCYWFGSLLPSGFDWNIIFTVKLTLFLLLQNCTLPSITLPPFLLHFL